MQKSYNVNSPAELVMLEGDYIPRNMSYQEYLYIKKYHPELLGFWAKLIKGVAKVGKRVGRRFGRRIRARIKKRRASRRKRQRAARQKSRAASLHKLALQRQQQQVVAAQAARKRAKQKQLTTIAAVGIPAAAMVFLLGK